MDEFLAGLGDNALLALPWLFEFWALPHQVPPDGAWKTWVIMGGRGAGKTRAGAEWVRAEVEGAGPRDPGRARRVALVGETVDQVREVMVMGESGILACSPPDRRPDWEAGRKRLVWPNGAVAQVYSAFDPDSLRGPQFDAAWVDELAKWKRAGETWDMLQFALRLGAHPRQVVTTTPQNVEVLKAVLKNPSTVVTHAPTEANRAYLAASFLDEVRARYAGTRIGRQELDGMLIEDVDGALWTQAMLMAASVDRAPRMDRIVVAVDPPVSGHAGSDECGIVVVGAVTQGPPQDWRAVVLEDASIAAASPDQWAQAALDAMHRHGADRLVAEVNQGGALVETVIRQRDARIPGTGEYALATTPVHYTAGPGANRTANMHFPSGRTDFATSLSQLRGELPGCGSVSVIVSWFGDDLRCGRCTVRPKVEQKTNDGVGMPWRAGGILRSSAQTIPQVGGRSVYGGTPADQSVIEAIRAIRAGGQEVMFYPFVLMDQVDGNTLPDPWTGLVGQPAFPWRGRITLDAAPGQSASTDRTAAAAAEVSAFFGAAQVSHFGRSGDVISYSGPVDWGYRRFILHYAQLCAAAGGVDAFCIGSEMRGLTQIRSGGDSFPAVVAMRQLAADVRSILGAATKISYAADWSEYFGYHDVDGNVYFHLDPLWSDANIDFVGIDNYMPVSDWRDGEDHADAAWGAIHNLEYLKANIAGGEGFDWFYDSAEGAQAQLRRAITDEAYGEPWIYRYKDLQSWWSLPHYDRIGGVRSATPTQWTPRSKPFRFTEIGCAAIDKGSNEPNKFLDPKSSESGLPRYSNGRRDDLIQMQFLRAMSEFWAEAGNNPVSPVYGAAMVDMAHAHVWAWDARPFPVFPNLGSLWSDGENYARGHWINGRSSGQDLASVVSDICERSGVTAFDVSKLYGFLRGYAIADVDTARAALQPLMLAYGFDAVERDGELQFRMRDSRAAAALSVDQLAVSGEIDGSVELGRVAEAEVTGRVRLAFVDAEGSFETRQAEAIFPDDSSTSVSQSEVPLSLTLAEGRAIVERWLSEARIARDSVRFALPKSALQIGAGDVVTLGTERFRIDRIEQTEYQQLEGVRVEPASYQPSEAVERPQSAQPFAAPVPVFPVFLDLPLLEGTEVAHAPHLAVSATPWPGSVAVWSSASDEGYVLNRLLSVPSVVGLTETALSPARAGLLDQGAPLRVMMFGGVANSAEFPAVLNGANVAAIGDGSTDIWEVFQFTRAELVAPQTYELSGRLRGQAGSDAVMPSVWPVGSLVVLLDRGPEQIDLPLSARGLARHYRIGSAERGYDDPAVVHRVDAFSGVGLRPYRPAHLRAQSAPSGDLALSWVRRTRIDGDGWQVSDVPVGEDREAYLVRIVVGSATVREVAVDAAGWVYPAALRVTDGTVSGCTISVAQVSDRFGPGPFASVLVGA